MSRRLLPLSLGLTIAAAIALMSAPGASAALHSLRLDVDQPGYSGATKRVYLSIEGVDAALSTQITVRRAGVVTPIEDEFEFSGDDQISTYDLDLLEPGDVIEIRQPYNAVNPTLTYQSPAASAAVTGTTISGLIGPGYRNVLGVDQTCLSESAEVPLPAGGGAFSESLGAALPAGARFHLRNFDARGFEFELNGLAPGERPCVSTTGVPPQYETGNPGSKDPAPYYIQVDDLTQLVSTGRVVLRRAGAIIFDKSSSASSSMYFNMATAPLPGDQIEIYRPQEAATPTHVVTIPQVSGVFDPSVDQAAITGPAGREARVFACQPLVCAGSGRTLLDIPAGRTFFDFTKPVSYEIPFDLQPDTRVQGTFQSATEPIEYRFGMPQGDLVSPVQSFKFPSKVSRSKLSKSFKKGLKVKVKSNEAGRASLTLAFPKAKAGKAVTLAKASRAVAAGTTTVKLKFTKAGKKGLKKLRKRSSRTATLTSTVTDDAGNVSTIVKRAKVKA